MSNSTTHQPKPIVLVILDGWGEREQEKHNSIKLANTPCFDNLLAHYPHTSLEASGEDLDDMAGEDLNAGYIAEIFLPPRFTDAAQRFQLRAGVAMDLSTCKKDGSLWDLVYED